MRIIKAKSKVLIETSANFFIQQAMAKLKPRIIRSTKGAARVKPDDGLRAPRIIWIEPEHSLMKWNARPDELCFSYSSGAVDASGIYFKVSLQEALAIADGKQSFVRQYKCQSTNCDAVFPDSSNLCPHCDVEDDPSLGEFPVDAVSDRLSELGFSGIGRQSTRSNLLERFKNPCRQRSKEDLGPGESAPSFLEYETPSAIVSIYFDEADFASTVVIGPPRHLDPTAP